jgi:hypothetical protein
MPPRGRTGGGWAGREGGMFVQALRQLVLSLFFYEGGLHNQRARARRPQSISSAGRCGSNAPSGLRRRSETQNSLQIKFPSYTTSTYLSQATLLHIYSRIAPRVLIASCGQPAPQCARSALCSSGTVKLCPGSS